MAHDGKNPRRSAMRRHARRHASRNTSIFHVAVTSCSILQAYLWLIGDLVWPVRESCLAHDEISDPMLNVSFIGLPVAGFAVNGATPAHDLALVTGGAQGRLGSGVGFLAEVAAGIARHPPTCP